MEELPDLGDPEAFGAPESTDPFTPQARHLVVVSGGLGDPSSSRQLADRLAAAAHRQQADAEAPVQVHLRRGVADEGAVGGDDALHHAVFLALAAPLVGLGGPFRLLAGQAQAADVGEDTGRTRW